MNTATDTASCVARALVAADADGLPSHGVSRVPFYAAQARAGKVDGRARPSLTQPRTGAVRVDARDGFAFPAIRLGIDRALELLEAPRDAAGALPITAFAGDAPLT